MKLADGLPPVRPVKGWLRRLWWRLRRRVLYEPDPDAEWTAVSKVSLKPSFMMIYEDTGPGEVIVTFRIDEHGRAIQIKADPDHEQGWVDVEEPEGGWPVTFSYGPDSTVRIGDANDSSR